MHGFLLSLLFDGVGFRHRLTVAIRVGVSCWNGDALLC